MVDYAFTAVTQFDAGHSVAGYLNCSRRGHGHTWTVSATVEGPLERDDDTGVWATAFSDGLTDDLERIARELDGRDLNDMAPGADSTPEGLAAWFLERLADVDFVEVEMGWRRVRGTARRNRKR